jgi:deoxyribonuclease V
MMKTSPESLNFSLSKAYNAQKILSHRIIDEDRLPQEITHVGGVDVAYIGNMAIGAVTVLNYQSLKPLESQTATCEVKLPYIPTLFAFREIPPAVTCIKKLKLQPDVLLVDGHGMAHPNRCGFASHLGIVIGKPTIGVAKNKLIGVPMKIAEKVFLVDKGQIVGSVVKTRENAKPVYVSIGNSVSLDAAVEIVKKCSVINRLPEPIRLAHEIASREKRKYVG